jgi:hypothetical protein
VHQRGFLRQYQLLMVAEDIRDLSFVKKISIIPEIKEENAAVRKIRPQNFSLLTPEPGSQAGFPNYHGRYLGKYRGNASDPEHSNTRVEIAKKRDHHF